MPKLRRKTLCEEVFGISLNCKEENDRFEVIAIFILDSYLPRYAILASLRFGFDGLGYKSLAKCGSLMWNEALNCKGIGAERIRCMLAQIIRRLRRKHRLFKSCPSIAAWTLEADINEEKYD